MGTPVAAKGNRGFLVHQRIFRAISSVGRASDLHSEGRRFESDIGPLKRQAREACQQIDKSDNPFSSYPVMGTDKQNNLGH